MSLREGEEEWKWRRTRGLFQWEEEKLSALQSLILQSGFKGEGEDRWVWSMDMNGQFSVRLAYRLLCGLETSGDDAFYRRLWKGGAPLKVIAFVWKLAKDRIPSLVNLACQNVNIN